VALAIRKFQRFESNKFKNSLECNFDKQSALEELRLLYNEEEAFFVREFVKVAYFIRKFSLTFTDLRFRENEDLGRCALVDDICKHLKDGCKPNAPSDQKFVYFLCLSLKYLTRNSSNETSVIPLNISQIVELIESCSSSLIKSELVALLAYLIEKSNTLSKELNIKLENLVLSLTELNHEAKAFFLTKLESNKSMNLHATGVEEKNKDAKVGKTMAIQNVKRNQQVVTKTMQAVKSKHETKNSEETDFKFLNLSDCTKNRIRKLNHNIVLENVETINDKGGDDRSIFRSTWAEVINLFSLVSQGHTIKADDKDNYLPKKFLGDHYYVDKIKFIEGKKAKIMYSFFINRMCASIFFKISRKQQLNSNAIDKLLKCVTNIDSLISVLELNNDYVEMFVDRILLRYWDLKALTSPDVVVSFVKAIMNKTTEEYVSKGWFYNSAYVRRKSFDHAEVEKIILTEIYKVRRDTIRALYNCAIRDKTILTAVRVKQIQACMANKDDRHDDSTFKDYIFKLIELAESTPDFDYKETFASYITVLNGELSNNIEAILRFVYSQARDLGRSQELFSNEAIRTLIKLLGSSHSMHGSTKQKLNVLEIINTYLEHDVTEGMSENNLKLLLNNTFESGDSALIHMTLASLLLLADKAQSLPSSILKMLVANLHLLFPKEDYSSYMLFILSRAICAEHAPIDCLLRDSDDVERVSYKLQCDNIVDLSDNDCDEEQRVKFEAPTEKNRHNSSNQISLLTAKIILKSTENKIMLSSVTIDNLLLTLTGNNKDEKQSKIVSSKCLYFASKYMTFENGHLNQMIDLINSEVYDIGVYIQAAYLKGCVKLAFSSTQSLESIHLENISSLYVSESLKLGLDDYKSEINKNLFQTLLYEARKQKFNDKNLFPLFDSIFNLNEPYGAQILEILAAYTTRYCVPDSTVKTLETVLSFSNHFEKALLVLQNVILSGMALVTSKTLNIFIDYLYMSINSRLRFYSFKLLQKVSQNQELADDIFCKFEMAKAGFLLDHHAKQVNVTDRQMIIEFIQTQTDKGMQLPIDTKLALEKELSNRGVLKIFANISKNRQIIQQNLLNAFISMFDPKKDDVKTDNILLISIFENAVKNNQTLPRHLLGKLEEALHCKDLEQKVFPVFIYLAQKGEKLSEHVNNKLLDQLLIEENLVLKQELLSSLGSLIDANQDDIQSYQKKINVILIKNINCNNFNVQKLCIMVIGKLATVTKQIDDELLHKLIQVGTNINSDRTIRFEICSLFDCIEDSCKSFNHIKFYKQQIKLANLNFNSDEELLAHLNDFVNTEDGFFEQNYKQLKEIIDKGDSKVQQKALNILYRSKNKSKMKDELLESVAILYESTMSDILKTSCLQLCTKAAENGKILKNRARIIWDEHVNRGENIKKFIQSQVYMELQNNFHLNSRIVEDVLKLIKVSEKISDIDNLADLVQMIMKENPVYFESKSFVLLIEQCLIHRQIIETSLPCYCRIIKEEKHCQVGDCLRILAENFRKNCTYSDIQGDLLTQLVEAMYYARKLVRLPDDCIRLLEDNLDHPNEIIRGYSFRTLRITSKDDNYVKSSIFNDWCDKVLENLAQNGIYVEKFKDYLDYLEIIVSVKFLDVALFTNNEKAVWKRELLVSSIFQSFEVYPMDQIHFYSSWFLVQDKFQYQKSCKILNWIHMCKFDSIADIVELISIMPEMEFDNIVQMLRIYGPAPYEAVKQKWCMKKIQKYVPSKDSINKCYLNKLVEKFCLGFDVNVIGKIFACIKSVDNLRAFEDLIDFCKIEKIDLTNMEFENVGLNELKCLIEAKHLCNHVTSQSETEAEDKSLLKIIQILLNEGCHFDQLRGIVNSFSFPKVSNVIQILTTIHKYNLFSSYNLGNCKQILKDSKSFTESIRKINSLAIENNFQLEGKIKDLGELLAELKKLNPHLIQDIDKGYLDIKNKIFNFQSAKFDWNKKQISIWAKEIKESGKEFSNYEAIAVIMRANFLITDHRLTDTQILSSLIALKQEVNVKGKLLEVATGEGKSTIVCILAIINGLRGKQVYVVTSSPVLAERDAKQKAKLYRRFNLTCSNNNDNTVYLKGAKDCYKADIVYGECSQFQFDILRDNYSKLGTLGKRKCTTAIVDEVDSMLIDDSSKIARLSSTVAGMDHFQAIYVFIWQRLISIKEKFIMFANKMYFIDGKVGFENGKITLEIPDNSDDNKIWQIPDLESYLRNTADISEVGEVVGDDLDDYLIKSLGNYLDSQIKTNQVYIPSNFIGFLEKQKSKWIFNAIEALNYQENVHYVVQDGQIKPVDYYSTGIVQSSTNWSDGLHQFLQLKHNLKMTSETLTSNFLSNIGFITKFKEVFGLTGTLGSETARNVLRNVYKVQLINMPQRRQRQYLELEPAIVQGEANWLKEIISTVMLEVKKERGMLIICETIEHANKIREMLQNKLRSSAVKLYTMNDMNQEKNVERILPGEVIIATNLAGRGTDIQTDEIEVSGGLHVILTFLPSNQRVEDQAFGRTARQGKRGTGVMILNADNLVGCTNTTTKEVTKTQRNTIESELLKNFEQNELKLIQIKDELFDAFCTFLNDKIRVAIRKEHNSRALKVMNWFTDVQPTVYEYNVLASVEEQWAVFLRQIDDGEIKPEEAEERCKALIVQLHEDFKNNSLIKNPYYFNCIAYDIIVNEWSVSDSSKARRALDYFQKAIDLEENPKRKKKEPKLSTDGMETSKDDSFTAATSTKASKQDQFTAIGNNETPYGAGAAHFGVAWCLIKLKETNYKEKALKSFKDALHCLLNEMSLLNTTQILLEQKQVGFINSDLYKQLNVKVTILGSYLNATQSCIDAIKRSLRLIDLVATKEFKEGNNVLERTLYFKELQRNEIKKNAFIEETVTLNGNESYSLMFNCLTTREDSWLPGMDGTKDQALMTLRNAFDETISTSETKSEALRSKFTNALKGKKCGLNMSSYHEIQIKLKQVDLAGIRSAVFNPDKEFRDLTRETAIAKLKEERTYVDAVTGTICNTEIHRDVNKLAYSLINEYNPVRTLMHASNETNTHKVYLTIISSTDGRKLQEGVNYKHINDVIKVIEEQSSIDETLRFDIIIKKSNENKINKFFTLNQGHKQSIRLNIEFDNLDQDAAKKKLSSIKAKSVDIELVLSKLNLIKLIQENPKLKCGKLSISEQNLYEKVPINDLLKRVDELKTDDSPCYIKFENLTDDQVTNIVEKCDQNVLFTVYFHDINDIYASGLDDGQVNFYFDQLSHETAEIVIKVLRKEMFEFSLEFKNLSNKLVAFILKNASLDQEDIEIRKVKNLRDLYMTGAIPNLELAEFAAKGIEHFIEINERQFVPWRSVVAVAILGACQIILGGVLIATGFGSGVGMGFITEGLADMFTAYRAYSTRQFHWSDYCKQKAISLVISAVSMGYSKFKQGVQDAAKGIETIVTGVGKEALEQAGTNVVSNFSTVGQTMIKTSKNLKSIAFKYIGVKAGEAAAREGLNSGIQCLSNFSFELIKPKICEAIQSRVRSSFCNTELMSLLRKMYAIDLTTSSNQLQSRIEKIVSDTINPQHDFARQQWNSIGLPLLKGVLSDSSKFGSCGSMSIRIIGTLNGLNHLGVLIENVVGELVAKLRLADRNSMTIGLVLHGSLKINKDNAFSIGNMLKKLKIVDEFDNLEVSHSDVSGTSEKLKIKIDAFSYSWKTNPKSILLDLNMKSDAKKENMKSDAMRDVTKSIEFVNSFYEKFVTIDLDSFSTIIKSISDQVADQLIRIIDSQLIQPWSTLAVSSVTDSLSKRIQHSSLVNSNQNSDSQNADQEKYEELKNRNDLTQDDVAFMNSYGKFRTFAEQINYNSRDHCIAYSQCEMVYYATKENNAGSSHEKVKQTADGVRDGKAANLGVIIATAQKNGINLKVVDDKDYLKTQDDIEKGVEVIYVERGLNNEIGHAYYMNRNGQFIDAKSEGYDCFFAAFGQILASNGINKSISELRNEAAQQIESNSKNYSKC